MNFEHNKQSPSQRKMAIITLTTDMGNSDYYVAAVKGAIFSELPDVNLVDISHDIPKFDRMKTGFILRNCFRYFPAGTVHLVGVETLEDDETMHVALKAGGHYFVGADTGVFSLILDEPAEEIVQLRKAKGASSETFPTLNLFATAACHLARGEPLQALGKKHQNYRQMLMHAPPIGSDHLRANIIYIDSYGNLITNVKRSLFDEVGKGLQVEIVLRNNKHSIKRINTNYNEVGENDLVALFNSGGYLEIALNRGAANKLLGLKVNDSVRIEFHV
jgi:S-adenosylmethionine hydrolase